MLNVIKKVNNLLIEKFSDRLCLVSLNQKLNPEIEEESEFKLEVVAHPLSPYHFINEEKCRDEVVLGFHLYSKKENEVELLELIEELQSELFSSQNFSTRNTQVEKIYEKGKNFSEYLILATFTL